jgi:hypothetical protein
MELAARVVLYEPDDSRCGVLVKRLQEDGCTVLVYDDLSRAAAIRDSSVGEVFICRVNDRTDLAVLGGRPEGPIATVALTSSADCRASLEAAGVEFVVPMPVAYPQLRATLVDAIQCTANYGAREEAKVAFGQTVVHAVEDALGEGALRRPEYPATLQSAIEAFPNTSIHELTSGMIGGIRERADAPPR